MYSARLCLISVLVFAIGVASGCGMGGSAGAPTKAPVSSAPATQKKTAPAPKSPQVEHKGLTVVLESSEYGQDGTTFLIGVTNNTKALVEFVEDEFFLVVDDENVLRGAAIAEDETNSIGIGETKAIVIVFPAVSEGSEATFLMCEFIGENGVRLEIDFPLHTK